MPTPPEPDDGTPRRPRGRRLIVLGAFAAVAFLLVCIAVGISVAGDGPAHATPRGTALDELPSAGSFVGTVALLTAVVLSAVTAAVSVFFVLRTPELAGDEAAEDRRG